MTTLLAVLWTLLAPVTPVAPLPALPESLDSLAWLAGCWESRVGERVTLEMWSPPSGGLMVGANRTVVAGRARAFEHLRIRETPDGLVYTAIPSGQTETSFVSTGPAPDVGFEVGFEDGFEDGFVVENPEHDFPTRITYRRAGDEAFTALVEGPGDDGAMSGFGIEFRRVMCESGATP